VPVDAPNETVVAAPPIFRVVAVVLNRFAVVFEEIMSAVAPPLTVIPFEAVTRPVKVEAPVTVRFPSALTSPVEDRVTPVEPYPPPTETSLMVRVAPPALRAVAFGSSTVELLTVIVPDEAPNETVVAAPPIFRVVAVVSNREAEV
jgi:hypothetical protein